ncbi:Hypothetical predicted protein [Pelobates cultripes]|uniref:Uncharacterized protein n=1 Tax=Pelobates cultripes TaxID=61616 RepID=A0AAD1T5K7_PELCU|nr:Hypothetical predicted protein [Pelobates cultripes]
MIHTISLILSSIQPSNLPHRNRQEKLHLFSKPKSCPNGNVNLGHTSHPRSWALSSSCVDTHWRQQTFLPQPDRTTYMPALRCRSQKPLAEGRDIGSLLQRLAPPKTVHAPEEDWQAAGRASSTEQTHGHRSKHHPRH